LNYLLTGSNANNKARRFAFDFLALLCILVPPKIPYKMKTSKVFAATLLLSSLLIFSHCSPSFDYVTNTKEIISSGTWSVGYFFADADRTGAFKNYAFHFSNSGTLNVEANGNTLNGVWQVTKNIEGADIVHIESSTQDPALQQLNGDWKVTGKNIVNISLQAKEHGNSQLQINKF
jgi:hypothetical protein